MVSLTSTISTPSPALSVHQAVVLVVVVGLLLLLLLAYIGLRQLLTKRRDNPEVDLEVAQPKDNSAESLPVETPTVGLMSDDKFIDLEAQTSPTPIVTFRYQTTTSTKRRPRKLMKRRNYRTIGPGPYAKTGFPEYGFAVGLPFIPYKTSGTTPRVRSPLYQVTTCLPDQESFSPPALTADLSSLAADIVGRHPDHPSASNDTNNFNRIPVKADYPWIPVRMRVGLTPSMVFSDFPSLPMPPIILAETTLRLFEIADSVVGAHPDALPLSERFSPATSTSKTDFPWVPSGMKFGLVHTLDTRLAPPPASSAPVLSKSKRRSPDELGLVRGYQQGTGLFPPKSPFKYGRPSGKENRYPLPPAQARVRRY